MSKLRSSRKSRRMIRKNRHYFLRIAIKDYDLIHRIKDFTSFFYNFGIDTKRYDLTIKEFCDAYLDVIGREDYE